MENNSSTSSNISTTIASHEAKTTHTTSKGSALQSLFSGSIISRILVIVWMASWVFAIIYAIYIWFNPDEPIKYIFYDLEKKSYIGLKQNKTCGYTPDFNKAAKFVCESSDQYTCINTFKHHNSDFLLYTQGEGRIVYPAYMPKNSVGWLRIALTPKDEKIDFSSPEAKQMRSVISSLHDSSLLLENKVVNEEKSKIKYKENYELENQNLRGNRLKSRDKLIKY